MVRSTSKSKNTLIQYKEENPSFKYTTVSIAEVIEQDFLLDAKSFSLERGQAIKNLKDCKYPIEKLNDRFIKDAFYIGRFKRIYIEKKYGIPLILPSQITEIYPKAVKFISLNSYPDIEKIKAKKNQVLLTRSGTPGIISYVSDTLNNKVLSDDIIRIETTEYPGYLYTYLKSKIGQTLIKTSSYGAVIKHIEPEHLHGIFLPNPTPDLKQNIHNLIEESFKLRDDSNILINESQTLLKEILHLPNIEELKSKIKKFNKQAELLNYSIPLNKWDNRLDASYHVPIVQAIENHLHKYAQELVAIGNNRISQSIILPGRFKRVYVEKGNGMIFFGGKQLLELDPGNKKYLSLAHHGTRIREHLINGRKNSIAVV